MNFLQNIRLQMQNRERNIKSCVYIVAWYDEHGCYDELHCRDLISASRWNDYEAKDDDYIKVFAIIKIKNKEYSIELFDSRR